MKHVLKVIVATMLGLGSFAHANTDSGMDGMVRTKASVSKEAWVAPDVDFSKYTKIMLAPAEFDFREVKKTPRYSSFTSHRQEFYIDERDRGRLIETVTEIFDEELAKTQHFEIVTEPGEDVLVLQGGLMDIVSKTPPQHIGMGETWVRSVGEATLVIQVSDSMTGEVLFHASDRKGIERLGRDLFEANRVTAWAEVRLWARRWATALKKDFDAVHA